MSKETHKIVTAEVDYVQGYLRSGYYSLHLNEEQWKEFEALDREERLQYIRECGEIEVSDFRIEDIGDISSYEVH